MTPKNSPFAHAIGVLNQDSIALLGTCFLVGANLVATAAHVIGRSTSSLMLVSRDFGLNPSEYQDTTSTVAHTAALEVVSFDPVRDIAILRGDSINAYTPHIISSSDEVSVGSEIFTVGFPHAPDGRLVRTAHSSLVGAKILMGTDLLKYKHLVLNMQTRPGQSGSPVFNANGDKIVGMVLGGYSGGSGGGISLGGIIPSTLHQTTHAISAEYIKDMLP